MKNTDPKRFYEIGKKTWNDFNKQFPTYNDFQKLMDEDPENLVNFDILLSEAFSKFSTPYRFPAS